MSAFFTNRHQGSSLGAYASLNFGFHVGDDPVAVTANRRSLPSTQFMNQVHGNQVCVVTELLDQDPVCDALVTTVPGISLAVMVADCIPLLLISRNAVAAVHVGRAGLLNGVAPMTVETMSSLGARDIHAVIGPSICGLCYEVPAAMQEEVCVGHPKARSTTRQHTPSLDLSAALIAQLSGYGVTYEASPVCTYESELYFSHRRDKPTGRFAGVVSL